MLGSHLSISGGMYKALDEAGRLGMECVQVFTKNQRRWAVPPLTEDDRSAWLSSLAELGWEDPESLRTVSHNSYLINMASPDPEGRAKSIALQREELERCEAKEVCHLPRSQASGFALVGRPAIGLDDKEERAVVREG